MLDRGSAGPSFRGHPTLLDLVATVGELTTSDADVVAVVSHLIDSGRVRLGGCEASRVDTAR